jgi:hypothetical protein
MRPIHVLFTLLLVAGAFCPAQRAFAETNTTTPVLLRYAAPDTCPSSATFRDEVMSRTQVVTFRSGAEPTTNLGAATLEVGITQQANGYVARMHLLRGDLPTQRRLADRNCVSLVRALALVSALAIDPSANTEASLPAPAPSVAPPAPSETAAPRMPEAPPARTAIPAPELAPRDRSRNGHAGAHVRITSALAMGYEALSGATPGLLGGVTLHSPRLQWRGRPGGDESAAATWAGPMLGFAMSWLDASAGFGYDETAHYALIRARTELVPFSFGGERWHVGPLLSFAGGAIVARGYGVDAPQSQTLAWLDVGAAFEATRCFGVLCVGGSLGAIAPLRRGTFIFERPRRVLHEVGLLGLDAEANLGVKFW